MSRTVLRHLIDEIPPSTTTLANDSRFVIRRLEKRDAASFGRFLEGLSARTRGFYRPHALTASKAQLICDSLAEDESLRLVATPGEKSDIDGYFLTEFTIPEDEKQRYASYGISIEDGVDCRIAPVISDRMQNNGLGTVLLRQGLETLHHLGVRHVVLFGGTQAGNPRAIRVYGKCGFVPIGTFRTKNIDNIDMWIPDLGTARIERS